MVFLVAITVVAEIADGAGVFDVAGHWAAHAGRHRAWLLWLLFVLLAVAARSCFSLDTTAVLLTPVGLAVARQLGLDARAVRDDHALAGQHRHRCCCPCRT